MSMKIGVGCAVIGAAVIGLAILGALVGDPEKDAVDVTAAPATSAPAAPTTLAPTALAPATSAPPAPAAATPAAPNDCTSPGELNKRICEATAAGRKRGEAYTGPRWGGPQKSTENPWCEDHNYPGATQDDRFVRGYYETECRRVARAKQ
ncbi:hypothetical protein [Streptomyces sp. NPDC017949]